MFPADKLPPANMTESINVFEHGQLYARMTTFYEFYGRTAYGSDSYHFDLAFLGVSGLKDTTPGAGDDTKVAQTGPTSGEATCDSEPTLKAMLANGMLSLDRLS